jgi:hypothetical protein
MASAPTPSELLQLAAFGLHQAAPREWQLFIDTFDVYVADTTKKLVAAEPQMLVNYQGQAVQAQHIFNLLNGAQKTAEALRAKQKPR